MKGVKGEVYTKEEKERRNEDVHCTVITCNEKDKKKRTIRELFPSRVCHTTTRKHLIKNGSIGYLIKSSGPSPFLSTRILHNYLIHFSKKFQIYLMAHVHCAGGIKSHGLSGLTTNV